MGNLQLHARRLTAVVVAAALAFPGTAYAQVLVDGTELLDGANAVGGGTATYGSGSLGMENVTATNVSTDESLDVSFNGGNDINDFQVTGDANVTVDFSGDNSVEDIEAYDNSNLTVNLNSHDDCEDIEAYNNSSLTVNVTGETGCEAIKGYDDASVTVQGTTCPRADVITVGEGEASERIGTERGDLVIKDATVVMDSKEAKVSSTEGNVSVYCSKISGGDDNERTDIYAGGDLFVGGSVIDVEGTMSSDGEMTIRRSDVDVTKPDGDSNPYRVWSKTGINLIEELNGEVRDGKIGDTPVKYLKTDDDDAGDKVHLVSAIKPCYYTKCESDGGPDGGDSNRAKKLPITGDANESALPAMVLGCGVALVALDIRRRQSAQQ